MMQQMVNLPNGYADAETLATAMLAAATEGDWDAVASLRRAIPAMARSLDREWSAIGASDPQQVRRLEKERIGAIRRVLAVDDQIRRLSEAWRGPIDGWLRGATATRSPS
jgi:Flagellar protein FliT